MKKHFVTNKKGDLNYLNKIDYFFDNKIPLVIIFKRNRKVYCNIELDCISALPFHTLKESICEDFFPIQFEKLMDKYPIPIKSRVYQGGHLTVYFKTKLIYAEEIAAQLFDYGVDFIKKNKCVDVHKITFTLMVLRNSVIHDNHNIFNSSHPQASFWASDEPRKFMMDNFEDYKDYLNTVDIDKLHITEVHDLVVEYLKNK